MIGFREVVQIEKSVSDAPRLEMSKFIKIIHKELIGFRAVAQIEKSSSIHKEMIGFRWVAQIEKSSSDAPRLDMSKFRKRSHKEMICFRGGG